MHLFYDYDRVYLPVGGISGSSERGLKTSGTPIARLQASARPLLRRVAERSIIIGIISPIVYALFIRRTAWHWMLVFARIVWDMPAAAELSYIPPYHFSLLFRSLSSSFSLLLIWEASSVILSSYVAQEPLRGELPLTDQSQDPNGSLINGLKSNKEIVKVRRIKRLIWGYQH